MWDGSLNDITEKRAGAGSINSGRLAPLLTDTLGNGQLYIVSRCTSHYLGGIVTEVVHHVVRLVKLV